MSKFYNRINNKGDKINLIANLISDNPDIINKPFEVIFNRKKTIQSPLTYCLLIKYTNIAKFLLEKGADINYKNYPDEDYPLHIATRFGFEDIVQIIINNPKTNLQCINNNKETCYRIALKNSKIKIFNLITTKIKEIEKKRYYIDNGVNTISHNISPENYSLDNFNFQIINKTDNNKVNDKLIYDLKNEYFQNNINHYNHNIHNTLSIPLSSDLIISIYYIIIYRCQ